MSDGSVIEGDWHGLHGESWTGIIVPEAFSHPAKYSRGLIRRIYQHAIDEDWLQEGDTVLDPFGGVALGAWPALPMGINWVALELEEKFVALGNQNIALWNSRYKDRLPKWGEAVLLQGDSRELAGVLEGAGLAGCVSSPPYIEALSNPSTKMEATGAGGPIHPRNYGSHPAQLGNMREGELGEVLADAVISSPPWLETEGFHDKEFSDQWGPKQSRTTQPAGYGQAEGQLAAMPEGDAPVACISSPPYAGSLHHTGHGIDLDKLAKPAYGPNSQAVHPTGYGSTPGNLAQLPEGDAPVACISSPPWEAVEVCQDKKFWLNDGRKVPPQGQAGYGNSPNQLGQESGDTFWSAARAIVQQVYQVLAPGGVAIWITKRFVRNKAIVEFSQQWAALCESVGFVTVHWHKAWLVEDNGTRLALIGEDERLVKKRYSFFRRLHSQKYPHLEIQWEDVICQARPR